MAFTPNRATSIRPLGAEHLRMFQRKIGPAPKVAPKIRQEPKEDFSLFIAEIGKPIPKGWRRATPEEVACEWKYNHAEFVERLRKESPIATSQVGIKQEWGIHLIEENGEFNKAGFEYYSHDSQDRARIYPGKGRVIISHENGLCLSVSTEESYPCPVLYVALVKKKND